MSCKVSSQANNKARSQIVAFDSDKPDLDDFEPESKSNFSKIFPRLLLLATILGLLATGVMAISVLQPDLLNPTQKPEAPKS